MSIFGLLNLNKPSGMTSRDAINRVQRLLPRRTKIGHAGTLDPLARGVLVASLGPATRLIDHVQRMPKSYTGTFLLGRHSPTEDTDGEVQELVDPVKPTREELVAAAARFVGRIEQQPPAFSALKVAGRRAYDLARAGKKVELASRPVDIYRLEVIAYDYPELTLDVQCGSGTYIRSLGRDLARSLGTEAVMSALVRTAIGDFAIDHAVDPTTLDESSLASHLLPPLTAVAALPRITLTDDEVTEIRHGRTIAYRPGTMDHAGQAQPDNSLPTAGRLLSADEGAAIGSSSNLEVVAVDADGRLVAILVPRYDLHLGPVRNFISQ